MNNLIFDPDQELLSLRLANIFGSFFVAFPVQASISKGPILSLFETNSPLYWDNNFFDFQNYIFIFFKLYYLWFHYYS